MKATSGLVGGSTAFTVNDHFTIGFLDELGGTRDNVMPKFLRAAPAAVESALRQRAQLVRKAYDAEVAAAAS